MVARFRRIAEKAQLREALDWTVFGLGLVSLTIAVAATILMQSGG